MNRIGLITVILAIGWYGNLLYKNNDLPFIQNSSTYFGSGEKVKCVTKEGRVIYGSVPQGTLCERLEPVKGSIKIVPSEIFRSNKDDDHRALGFKCDGRQYCSQMNSRAEAEYFVKNCPNTTMDGDHDGVPCENDSRF